MAAILRSESWARAERAEIQARAASPAPAHVKARPVAVPAAAMRALVRAPAKVQAMRAVGRALPAVRPAAAEATASRDSHSKYRPKRYLTGAARRVRLCSTPAKPDLKSDFIAAPSSWTLHPGKSRMYHSGGAEPSSRKIFPLPVQAAAICDPLKVGRKGIEFRYPLDWHGVGRTCPRFNREQGVAARGRYSCTPFSRSPVLGSGINLCSQPETNSSREQIKAAAARPVPAAGPKPTPSRLYPDAELLAGQYRRCADFASFDELMRQTLPAFQTRPSVHWFARDLKSPADLQPS